MRNGPYVAFPFSRVSGHSLSERFMVSTKKPLGRVSAIVPKVLEDWAGSRGNHTALNTAISSFVSVPSFLWVSQGNRARAKSTYP